MMVNNYRDAPMSVQSFETELATRPKIFVSNADAMTTKNKILHASFNIKRKPTSAKVTDITTLYSPRVFKLNLLKNKKLKIKKAKSPLIENGYSVNGFSVSDVYDSSLKKKKVKAKKATSPLIENGNSVKSLSTSDIPKSSSKKKLKTKKSESLIEKENAEKALSAADVNRNEVSASWPLPDVNIKTYKAVNREGFLLHIQKGAKFQILGFVNLTVVFGGIKIYGCELSSKFMRKTIQVFGAGDLKTYLVEADPTISSSLNDLIIDLKASNIIIEEYCPLYNNVKPGDTVIFLEQVKMPTLFDAKSYLTPYSLLNVERLYSALPDITQAMACVIDHVDNRYYNPIVIPPELDTLPIDGRTVVVGGKGLGKTTLLKCLLNKLLNVHGAVLWLEFDPGQGEFIPPGSVGFNILTKPVLGPNYTHCFTPERSVHLGTVDPNSCSSQYVTAIRLLVKLAREEYSSIPWLVNTMGFIKGLGLHLNKAVIQEVSPECVIQITGATSSNNFKSRLTPHEVNKKSKMFPWSRNSSIDYTLVILPSPVPSSTFKTGKNERNLMLISYLSGMLRAPLYYFHCAQPYSIPFDALFIGLSSQIEPQDLLAALNGSYVNLTAIDSSTVENCDRLEVQQPSGSWFKVVLYPPVLLSLGLGVVRGIDTASKELFLITPTPPHVLSSVNMLTISSVTLPSEIFLNQEGVEGEVPYTTKNTEEWAMASIQRLFKSPKKRF